MIIHSSTKNYEVKIANDFNDVENIGVDADTFFVIDKNLYNIVSNR